MMELKDKVKNIKAFFTDIDGTLTDGKLYYTNNGEEQKVFHVHDGLGLKLLMQAQINVGVISARSSKANNARMKELGISTLCLGQENKVAWLQNWLNENKLEWQNMAYIGDDLNDIEVLKKSGFAVAPNNAVQAVKDVADLITDKKGGEGAVREASDLILKILNEP